jgi:hypothetical protein
MAEPREPPLMDRRQQGRREKRTRFLQRRAQEDLHVVAASPAGRRFLYELIFARCGLANVYLPDDREGIHRHEGKRQIGQELARLLQEQHTAEYLLMITEQMQDQKEDAALVAASNPEPEDDQDG